MIALEFKKKHMIDVCDWGSLGSEGNGWFYLSADSFCETGNTH